MKTIPPSCPEPETGRKYWRSLDQLAETPEFRAWLEREFPQGASEFTDEVSRRHFMKIMSASFMLAGLGLGATGCRRPLEKLEPFGKQPEDYVFGTSQYYATAMPTRAGAVPLLARSYEGRPVKLEGNAQHPDSSGGTDRWTQASILNLYDPDRSRRFTKGGNNAAPEAAADFLKELSVAAQANGGRGLAFVVERNTSPSRQRLQRLIAQKFPNAKWYWHEPVDTDIHTRAAVTAFGGARVKPYFKFDAAKVIVSLDCDFIGGEEDAHNNIRKFVNGRRIEKPADTMNRLYVVEALMTLTGVNADHRWRVPAGRVASIAEALSQAVSGTAQAGSFSGSDLQWITECAKDLMANRGQSLVVAGHRQPLAVHLLAHSINAALGNVGRTVLLHEAPDAHELMALSELARSLNAGEVESLVILGANPVYNAPADLEWASAQTKAKRVIRLGYYEDETFASAQRSDDWHFPMAHFLESWGDARTTDGTLVPVQPLIAPLFGGWTEIEVLARIAGESVTNPYDIVRATFEQISGSKEDSAWRKFLYNGFLEGSGGSPVAAQLSQANIDNVLGAFRASGSPGKDSLEVVFYRDYSLDDGRYNNNGWLQELPDPITKVVWDNPVLISRKTAQELGVKNKDLVEIKLGGRAVRGPIWIQPGMADYTIGLALGYGRNWIGRVGSGVGFNFYLLRTSETGDIASGATVTATGETYPIACTQDHWSMEGRPIIREANLEQYREHPDFVMNMNGHQPPGGNRSLYPNPFDKEKAKGHHQWGMAIDLTACVGCSTCMMACQSENNIPIVGKDLVGRGREMHWLRIDRYYSAPATKHEWENPLKSETFNRESKQQFEQWIDDVQVVTQPMLCQHCEAAPCENVCPVNATVHDQEGLNVMVYNRCVGTRYCSNNCPYKVRRFNYLDYNKRSLKELKGPAYPPFSVKSLSRWLSNPQDPTAGMRPDDEWDLIRMMKNPDVTVRMRGVMEKCTFCVQRIEHAKIAQKVKARASGDVVVPDGTFTTACAQACPAGAIVFGNINDPESKVSKLKEQQRNYAVLDFLFTRPRTSYLARLRNPNKAMPDYYESPMTLDEFEARNGNPFEHHGEAGHAEAAHEGAEAAH